MICCASCVSKATVQLLENAASACRNPFLSSASKMCHNTTMLLLQCYYKQSTGNHYWSDMALNMEMIA